MIPDAQRIMLVCDQPEIIEWLVKQVLSDRSHHVHLVRTIAQAIQDLNRYSPHLILCSLALTSLSCKDLLVALSAQSMPIPVILLAEKGCESKLVQALRLGASDFILLPAKETEVWGVIERTLVRSRLREERNRLEQELSKSLQENQENTRLLASMRTMAKVLASNFTQATKIETLLKEAVTFCNADMGWLLRFQATSRNYLLAAAVNLPYGSHVLLGKAWDDGVAKMANQKNEAISLHGAALKKFPIGRFGEAALVVPIKAARIDHGTITLIRKSAQPFSEIDKKFLDMISEIIAILWWQTPFDK